MQFIQSGLGLMGFQVLRRCRQNILEASQTKAEDIIWFKIDENKSVIIFSSEDDAKEENAKRQELRKQTIEETGYSLVAETGNSVYLYSDQSLEYSVEFVALSEAILGNGSGRNLVHRMLPRKI